MNNSLLPSIYHQKIRREKIMRLVVVLLVLLSVVFLVGIVFMVPSYFTLVFSKQDVLRRLDLQEQSFARQDIKTLEAQVSRINKRAASYNKNEERRHNLFPLMRELARIDSASIRLSQISLIGSKEGIFTTTLKGGADTRDFFLIYVQKLKELGMFSRVDSPVTNLLHERNSTFELTATLSKEFYFYK